ncbi:hypothetical protein L249_2655 [Ophiocordyceps polyrhachis-furcata BCC 54312]|uniref:SCP domain-containing protein n=1 Tax=Ophiocordyceps polyrhachis-furcata BCC 54312 TaxID=1330021 RepID=A0A367LSN4_9HYPO|nr:hypothetical protein L249_2655 [Ophiocordyceps polyrhachis-furcata BCC 54312]
MELSPVEKEKSVYTNHSIDTTTFPFFLLPFQPTATSNPDFEIARPSSEILPRVNSFSGLPESNDTSAFFFFSTTRPVPVFHSKPGIPLFIRVEVILRRVAKLPQYIKKSINGYVVKQDIKNDQLSQAWKTRLFPVLEQPPQGSTCLFSSRNIPRDEQAKANDLRDLINLFSSSAGGPLSSPGWKVITASPIFHMQLTLLFTLGLSLQASAVPYPAGSGTRGDLQRRDIINENALTKEEIKAVDQAIKKETGKSIYDKDVQVEVVTGPESVPAAGADQVEVMAPDESTASPSSTVVQNHADNNNNNIDSSPPPDGPPSQPPTTKAAAPPSSKPTTKDEADKALEPVQVGKFRTTDPEQCYGILNQYRSLMGLGNLTKSSTLVSHAREASLQSSKTNLHHTHYNEGQVMAPGSATSFESVLVGGWLCEIPTLPVPGLQSACQKIDGWVYGGQTGHAQLLSDPSFTKAGCANENEVWTCSLSS